MNGLSHNDNFDAEPLKERLINLDQKRFLPLIIEVMRRGGVTRGELAKRTGFSPSKISRCLRARRRIDGFTLQMFFQALDIDDLRALLAIGRLGEWQQYFSPDIELITDLVHELPSCLSEARSDTVRFAIGIPGARVLAKKVSDIIATNDRDAQRRMTERPIAFL